MVSLLIHWVWFTCSFVTNSEWLVWVIAHVLHWLSWLWRSLVIGFLLNPKLVFIRLFSVDRGVFWGGACILVMGVLCWSCCWSTVGFLICCLDSNLTERKMARDDCLLEFQRCCWSGRLFKLIDYFFYFLWIMVSTIYSVVPLHLHNFNGLKYEELVWKTIWLKDGWKYIQSKGSILIGVVV